MSSRRSASSSAIRTFMSGILQGQYQGEARARGGGTLEGDAAAVALDDGFHQPQSKTHAGGLRFRAAAAEAVKEGGALSIERPGALILDPGAQAGTLGRGADAHGA